MHKLEFEMPEVRSVVGYLVDFEARKVIMGVRKQSSLDLGLQLISGIGGKVGDIEGFEEESSEEALVREFQEEVKITPTKFQKLGQITYIFSAKPKWSQVVIPFVITKWEGEPAETDDIKPEIFSLDEIPYHRMWEDNRYTVPHLVKGKSIDAVFIFNEDNETVKEFDISVR